MTWSTKILLVRGLSESSEALNLPGLILGARILFHRRFDFHQDRGEGMYCRVHEDP